MTKPLHLALALVLVSFWAAVAHGQGSIPLDRGESRRGLRFATAVSQSFGQTSYTMDALTQDPRDPDQLVPIRSELEFPLDATLLGLNVEWQPGSTAWSLGAGVRIGVDGSSEPITDRDFFGDKMIFFGESDPESDLFMATADVRYGLRNTDRGVIDLVLHIQYERIEQLGVGFEGWQGSLFSDIRAPISVTEPVIEYELNYLSSQVGVAAGLNAGRGIDVAISGAGGLVFAWDKDDHLRRGRISEGRGVGYALSTAGRLGWRPPVFGGSALRLDLWGELRYYRAEGGVDQTWYLGPSTGTGYTDIPYTLESTQSQVGLGITIVI